MANPRPLTTAPPPPVFHSGRYSSVQTGPDLTANHLPSTRWNVDPTVTVVEFKNAKTGLFAFKEGTFRECPFSFEIDWDFANNPFIDADQPLIAGLYLANVKLFLRDFVAGSDDTTADYWLFPSALIIGTPQSVETEGKITTTVNCTNDGPFAYPGVALEEGVTAQGFVTKEGLIIPYDRKNIKPRELPAHVRAAQARARSGVVMRPGGAGQSVIAKPITSALPGANVPNGGRILTPEEVADRIKAAQGKA